MTRLIIMCDLSCMIKMNVPVDTISRAQRHDDWCHKWKWEDWQQNRESMNEWEVWNNTECLRQKRRTKCRLDFDRSILEPCLRPNLSNKASPFWWTKMCAKTYRRPNRAARAIFSRKTKNDAHRAFVFNNQTKRLLPSCRERTGERLVSCQRLCRFIW